MTKFKLAKMYNIHTQKKRESEGLSFIGEFNAICTDFAQKLRVHCSKYGAKL